MREGVISTLMMMGGIWLMLKIIWNRSTPGWLQIAAGMALAFALTMLTVNLSLLAALAFAV